MTFETHSPEQTEALGEALGKVLKPGAVVAYTGDLGAGKTAFTRGLAKGLGASEPVTSPTYTIVNEYLSGRIPLFHFDMYRLGSSEDLFDIGWEDYLERGGRVRPGVERKCRRCPGKSHPGAAGKNRGKLPENHH